MSDNQNLDDALTENAHRSMTLGKRILRNAVAIGLSAIVYYGGHFANYEYWTYRTQKLTMDDYKRNIAHRVYEDASTATRMIDWGSLGFVLASLYVANKPKKSLD